MKVLIIEDDTDIRENTTEILQLEGFDVLTATNGREGISKLNETIPDVILCDLMMPEVDGYEVFKHVQQNKQFAEMPFIIFSASVEKKEIEKALSMGVSAFILKPFHPEDLLKTIQECIKKN